MKRRWILYAGELRRALTPMTIVLVIGMTILSSAVTLLPFSFGSRSVVSIGAIAGEASKTGLQFILALLFAGVVSNDIRNNWLRTLLTRPVTRGQYLWTKVSVFFTIGMSGILVAVISSVAVARWALSIPLNWEIGNLLFIMLMVVLQGALLGVMLAFLSCWLPGYMNLVAIAVWAVIAQVMDAVARASWWDQPLASTLVPFIFPSGFSDAIDSLMQGTGAPIAEILWGVAALCLFGALAQYSISRIGVERGSDE